MDRYFCFWQLKGGETSDSVVREGRVFDRHLLHRQLAGTQHQEQNCKVLRDCAVLCALFYYHSPDTTYFSSVISLS